MNTRDGGPAFPAKLPMGSAQSEEAFDFIFFGGMTLRDYFAAKAMGGMLAAGTTVDIDGERMFARRAATAYCIADAMLAAREATP